MVSIIIPVYNVEKYINRCIDSVINQTYKNIEIILVDDGSTDNSGKICDSYEKKDERIKVIHKENGGLSSSRNVGIDLSRGDIITFLDSDDYLSSEYIEKSVELYNRHNADIVVLKMIYVAENINEEIKNNTIPKIMEFNSEEAIEISLYQTYFSCCAPGKIYNKKIFKDIRFPLDKLSEDLAVCHELLGCAKKIVYCNEVGYYYRQRSMSIMHTFNIKRLDALKWCDNIEEFCKLNYPNIIKSAECRTFNVAIHLLLDLPKKDENRKVCYKDIISQIKRVRKDVMLDHKARKRERIAAVLSYLGEDFLKIVWNSKISIKK